jgi:hypothetical protein
VWTTTTTTTTTTATATATTSRLRSPSQTEAVNCHFNELILINFQQNAPHVNQSLTSLVATPTVAFKVLRFYVEIRFAKQQNVKIKI